MIVFLLCWKLKFTTLWSWTCLDHRPSVSVHLSHYSQLLIWATESEQWPNCPSHCHLSPQVCCHFHLMTLCDETYPWLFSIKSFLSAVAYNDSVSQSKTLQCTLRHYGFDLSVLHILCVHCLELHVCKAEAERIPLSSEMMTNRLLIVSGMI